MGRYKYIALVVFDAEVSVLFKHLVILLVLIAYAVQIEYHLALVVDKLDKISECVAIVGHCSCEYNLEVKS